MYFCGFLMIKYHKLISNLDLKHDTFSRDSLGSANKGPIFTMHFLVTRLHTLAYTGTDFQKVTCGMTSTPEANRLLPNLRDRRTISPNMCKLIIYYKILKTLKKS